EEKENCGWTTISLISFSCSSCISWFATEFLPRNTLNTRKERVMNIIHRLESYELMGACFEVYKDKGSGFLEAVYQECLEIELTTRKVHFKPQPQLALTYKGQALKTKYIPDFLCYDKIIVELKAVSA